LDGGGDETCKVRWVLVGRRNGLINAMEWDEEAITETDWGKERRIGRHSFKGVWLKDSCDHS
jgi:hypothetical protein